MHVTFDPLLIVAIVLFVVSMPVYLIAAAGRLTGLTEWMNCWLGLTYKLLLFVACVKYAAAKTGLGWWMLPAFAVCVLISMGIERGRAALRRLRAARKANQPLAADTPGNPV